MTNYDRNIKRAEDIIAQLEAADAISMDDYKRLAAEATALLQQCRAEIASMAEKCSISPNEV